MRTPARFPGLLLMLLALPAAAQAPQAKGDPDGLYLGVGLGQDMGGLFGFGITYWPTPWLSGFAGGGWAIVDFSYQTGVQLNLPTEKRVSPFVAGMYGYNGAIHIKNLEKLDGIYYGPTVGAGILLKQRSNRNYWQFSINVPIRSRQFLDDWEAIKLRPDVEVKADLLPVTLGVGFHLRL